MAISSDYLSKKQRIRIDFHEIIIKKRVMENQVLPKYCHCPRRERRVPCEGTTYCENILFLAFAKGVRNEVLNGIRTCVKNRGGEVPPIGKAKTFFTPEEIDRAAAATGFPEETESIITTEGNSSRHFPVDPQGELCFDNTERAPIHPEPESPFAGFRWIKGRFSAVLSDEFCAAGTGN